MYNEILEEKPNQSIIGFLELCKREGADINKIYQVALTTIRHLTGSKKTRELTVLDQTLQNKWYQSLQSGRPDYSVYDSDLYLGELWACWIIYSRKYLLAIQDRKSLFAKSIVDDIGLVERVADLGCGIGYTTAAIKSMYPRADVYGTNLENTVQTKIAKAMGAKYDFVIYPDCQSYPNQVDIIFASEYFEHIINPIDHLLDILQVTKPRALLVANTFTAKSIGHFDFYQVGGGWVDGKTTSRMFNDTLRNHGYKKMDTKLWNNRPAYWKLN